MALKHPFTTSFGTLQTKHVYIIEISDHNDNKGDGELPALISRAYTEATVEPHPPMMRDLLVPILEEDTRHDPDVVAALSKPSTRNTIAKAVLEAAVAGQHPNRQ